MRGAFPTSIHSLARCRSESVALPARERSWSAAARLNGVITTEALAEPEEQRAVAAFESICAIEATARLAISPESSESGRLAWGNLGWPRVGNLKWPSGREGLRFALFP